MWPSCRSPTATCCSCRRENVSAQETVPSSDDCRSSQPVKYKGKHYPGLMAGKKEREN